MIKAATANRDAMDKRTRWFSISLALMILKTLKYVSIFTYNNHTSNQGTTTDITHMQTAHPYPMK